MPILKKTLMLMFSISLILIGITVLWAQENAVDWESEQWDKTHATVVEFKGRSALMGRAFLKDVAFTNGVIEVDLYMPSGRRSYPGLIFRIQSLGDYERFYVRPHRSIMYADALQYTGVINGIAEWQICHGPGFTDFATIPTDGWINLKIEIKDSQAKVFLSDRKEPVLHIHELRHGISTGTIGVEGPLDGTAYFSNFRYRMDDTLQFDPPPHSDHPPGMIRDWDLSPVFKLGSLDLEIYPLSQVTADFDWQKIQAEDSGLVDIARYRRRAGRDPDCVLVKTIIQADEQEYRKLNFGYSDFINIYLNGNLLFSGNSSYRYRDLSFLGIVGLFDSVYLPLQEGDNELLLLVAESFGGWGFLCQDGTKDYLHEHLDLDWASRKIFKIPESVAYDPVHDVIYVSNYDGYNMGRPEGQSISKVALDGEILDKEWVKGLGNPTGLAVSDGWLYAVERQSLAVIDIETGEIVKRILIPNPGFLNDVAVDEEGILYISDSTKNIIFRYQNEILEAWVQGPEIQNPNGLIAYEDRIIFGNNGDITLKAVDKNSKRIEPILRFKSGIIDGIQKDLDSGLLVSLNEGKLFRIGLSGEITKILDTTASGVSCADFVYIPEKKAIIVPTFLDNRILKYTFSDD